MTSIGDRDRTPFVWFSGGFPVFPPNSLVEDAKRVLAELGQDKTGAFFRNLAREGNVGGVLAVLPEATWFGYLRDFLGKHSDLPSLDTREKVLQICTTGALREQWPSLKQLIIQQIDDIGGWSHSWQSDSRFQRNIRREKDGNYYMDEPDGTVVQVIGEKTTPETRLDFLSDAILRPYGRIRKVLNMFSVFAVSDDFREHPALYPKSMRYYVWTPEWGIMTPKWHMSQYFQVRTIRWRPDNNLCDPDWLAAQLLGEITDSIDRDVWKEHVDAYREKPNRLEDDCKFQMDFVLDTGLSIGEGDETYLEFEGRRFRWINNTPESRAILSVGCKDIRNRMAEIEAVNRLISVLVWKHGVPIVKGYGTAGAKRPIPLTWGGRQHVGLRIQPEYALASEKITSQDKRLALALYKEGKNAPSVFYQFINFWKILDLGIPKPKERSAWIEANVEEIFDGVEWKKEIQATGETITDYLNDSCRNAISHVHRTPTVDPDNYEDNTRLSKDSKLVEGLAKRLINSGAFG